ncbi:MAG: amidohydrolase, partial [Clostridia bacterium]|nr:amidohydrolase [Clostridia bacterium]
MFEKYLKIIDDNSLELFNVSDSLYDNSETNFKEFESVKILKEFLKGKGFEIEDNLANIPTAFKATYGRGEPYVGVLAEYDGLSGMSQVGAVDKQVSIDGKETNHGCGHNLFAGGSISAVLAIKEYID